MQADFGKWNLAHPLTEQLGPRRYNAQYGYSDVAKSLCFMFLIGGEVLNDLNTLREQIKDHPSLEVCSPDTVEYACRQLRQATQIITTPKGAVHHLNEHKGFNALLPRLCAQGGVLKKGAAYTLDYDGHIVENTKPDGAFTYKHTQGCYPVVLSLDKLPVFLQNRNGNTPESYDQLSLIT